MPNSFRYLLAVTGLVALLFAAISAWPLASTWLRSRTVQPVQHPPIVSVPAPPTSTGMSAQGSNSPAIYTQINPLPKTAASQPCGPDPANAIPANASNIRQLTGNRYVPGGWTTGDGDDSLGWCYSLGTINLYNRPDGDPLVPINLNRCALTVGKGTRLGMIRKEGNWLLVHSTFSTTGWVHERDVSDVQLGELSYQ